MAPKTGNSEMVRTCLSPWTGGRPKVRQRHIDRPTNPSEGRTFVSGHDARQRRPPASKAAARPDPAAVAAPQWAAESTTVEACLSKLAFLLAVLALLCASAVAAVLAVPEKLPPQLAALAPTARDDARMDRLAAELEQMRRTVQAQEQTAADLRAQQQQLTDQLAGLRAQVQQLQTQAQTESTGSVRRPAARPARRRARP